MPELSVAKEDQKPSRWKRTKTYLTDHAPEIALAVASTVGAVATIATYRLIQAWTDDELRFKESQRDAIDYAQAAGLDYYHFPGVGVQIHRPALEEAHYEDQTEV